MDIQGEVASGVLALFTQISVFINNLINFGAGAANGDKNATPSSSASASKDASPIADICKKTIEILSITGGKYIYNVTYKINDNISFTLNIPTMFNLDANGLVQLDNNRILVDEFNEKNKDQISLIQ